MEGECSSVNANGLQRLCTDSGLGTRWVFAQCFAGRHAGRAQELLVMSSEDVKAAASGHQSSLFGRDFPPRAAGLLISTVWNKARFSRITPYEVFKMGTSLNKQTYFIAGNRYAWCYLQKTMQWKKSHWNPALSDARLSGFNVLEQRCASSAWWCPVRVVALWPCSPSTVQVSIS